MLSDDQINISGGNISAGIEVDASLKAVIQYIKFHFKRFAKENKGSILVNEKGLSQRLCILLNRYAKKFPFFFHSEFMENADFGGSPQVDIGTISDEEKIIISDREYGEEDSFFSMEAKRLPTLPAHREKEYVVGHLKPCGAMERFKKGIHGSRLKYAAIIGYVQDDSFDNWFLKVNSWIEELAFDNQQKLWSIDDKLKQVDHEMKVLFEAHSVNTRATNEGDIDKIRLFHFWINLLQ